MATATAMKSEKDPEARTSQNLYNDDTDKIRDVDYPQLHGDTGSS